MLSTESHGHSFSFFYFRNARTSVKVHFQPPVFVGRQKHGNASSQTCVRLGIFMNVKVKKSQSSRFVESNTG